MNALCTKFIHVSMNKQRCPINVVRWTPDAKRLVTGAASGEFTLWNGYSYNFETIMQAHDTAIRSMSWSHDASFLISGDHAGVIKFWQPSLNNLKILPNAHREAVRQLT